MRLNTIRTRLFLGFTALSIIIISLFSISYYHLKNHEKKHELTDLVHHFRFKVAELVKNDVKFINNEITNLEFYQESNSVILQNRRNLRLSLDTSLLLISERLVRLDPEMGSKLNHIDSTLQTYHLIFTELVNKIEIRGFKDYGLEGRMTNYVHLLEDQFTDRVNLSDVLQLRRYEKDYFLRNEGIYIEKLNELSLKIEHELSKSDEQHCKEARTLIINYTKAFNDITIIESQIGLSPSDGLKGELGRLSADLDGQVNDLSDLADVRTAKITKKSAFIYKLTIFLSVLLSLILSYVIAVMISKPIKTLASSMNQFMVDNIELEDQDNVRKGIFEINNLRSSFSNLSGKIKHQFQEIQEKSSLLEQQNKALTQVNDELDRFLYSAAHDLRSPLTSLKGLIMLAKKEFSQLDVRSYLQMMLSSVERLEVFIQEIVDYAKNKKQAVNITPLNLNNLFQTIQDEYQFIQEAKQIEFKTYTEFDSELYSDGCRLNVVLSNLVSNAVRYADFDKDQPFIEMAAFVDKDMARIEITDNGIGIPEELQAQIFEMFFRAHESSKGSGLGLFIVKQTIDALKGDIKVRSKVKVGTHIVIEIPNHLPQQKPGNTDGISGHLRIAN